MGNTKAIIKREPMKLGMLEGASPAALIASASQVATALADMIEQQKLAINLKGKKYVKIEGWTTLLALLGATPREVSNERQGDGSYVATVELARISDGAVIGRASAECGGPKDHVWGKREPFAIRSMAATRATGKACRLAFSWIMSLAGYEATPAEEARDAIDAEFTEDPMAPLMASLAKLAVDQRLPEEAREFIAGKIAEGELTESHARKIIEHAEAKLK